MVVGTRDNERPDGRRRELDSVAAEVARRISDCRVTVGDLLTVDVPTSAADLVVLRDLFEQLDDANAALGRIAGLFVATGRTVLIYQNLEVWARAYFRTDGPNGILLVTSLELRSRPFVQRLVGTDFVP